MDQQTNTDLEQTDEEILTYDMSDEALEAAAGNKRVPASFTTFPCWMQPHCS